MAVSYQLVIDCSSPEPLALFWAEALHYVAATPPPGFASMDDFYRSIGIPEDELGHGIDRIEDPNGEGPAIWFQVVPDRKSVKNRLHIDVHASGGGSLEIRRSGSRRRLPGWSPSGPPGSVTSPRRARPLRGRDGRSRGQRVRHQLAGTESGRAHSP